MKEKSTFFGFESVPWEDKADRVRDVFDSVASNYDVMNDLMSVGLHRLWKRHFVAACRLSLGHQVLDVATGTGDIAKLMAKHIGPTGRLICTDINYQMLDAGKRRLLDAGLCEGLSIVQADAEALPFASAQFDRVTIAFGLRNVTDKDAALRSAYRVLKPGGRFMILEFSHPTNPQFKKIYDAYSFNVIPKVGKWVAGDEESYQYLVESIRKHPTQEVLKEMLRSAGFAHARYQNLTGGTVAIHEGIKL